MLFDGIQRFGGIERNELNRFESWFEKFPLAHQEDLRGKLRSDKDHNHEGAFFELFLHEIDAFLSFQGIDIWNLWHKASACFYINPNNTNVALPDALFRLPHAKGCDGKIKWFDGESIAQLVG